MTKVQDRTRTRKACTRKQTLQSEHFELTKQVARLSSLEEIFQFLEKNPLALLLDSSRFYQLRKASFRLHSADYRYKECCSNSHAAPRDGVVKFRSNDPGPNGYPGFYGRIRFSIDLGSELNAGFRPEEILRRFGVKLHSGSGNGKGTMQYDSTVFLDDFPAMRERIQCERTMLMLASRDPDKITWRYDE